VALRALPTGRPALTVQPQRELGGAPTERSRERARRSAQGPSGAGQTGPQPTPGTRTTIVPGDATGATTVPGQTTTPPATTEPPGTTTTPTTTAPPTTTTPPP
jgi:peptidoglycan DL-endopeptidase CwlO